MGWDMCIRLVTHQGDCCPSFSKRFCVFAWP